MAAVLDRFLQAIPRGNCYHLWLCTDLYLREPILEVLEKYGLGQVLSHWALDGLTGYMKLIKRNPWRLSEASQPQEPEHNGSGLMKSNNGNHCKETSAP